jgi:hypothetical protein
MSFYKFPKPCYNQKSIFYSEKNFSSLSAQNGPAASWPVRPLSPATLPGSPLISRAAHARSAHPGLRGLGVISKSHLFFEFAQPGGYAFPSATATRAPLVSSVVSPVPPTPVGISPRHRFPRAVASRLGCPRALIALPHHFPHLIPFKPSVNGP